jgi:hypothetical protein
VVVVVVGAGAGAAFGAVVVVVGAGAGAVVVVVGAERCFDRLVDAAVSADEDCACVKEAVVLADVLLPLAAWALGDAMAAEPISAPSEQMTIPEPTRARRFRITPGNCWNCLLLRTLFPRPHGCRSLGK